MDDRNVLGGELEPLWSDGYRAAGTAVVAGEA